MDVSRIRLERDPRYLSDEALVELTGYRNRRQQTAQLQIMGIPFALNIAGTPIVPVVGIEVSLAAGRREVKDFEARQSAVERRRELEAALRRKRSTA